MNTFDTKRFMQLCKWSVQTYRKEYYKTVMGFTIAFFIFLFIKMNMGSNVYYKDYIMSNAGYSSIGIMMFIVTIMPSFIFNNMKTKQDRLMYKLIPASLFEKFLTRYIYVTAFMTVGCVAAFCIADILRNSLAIVTGHGIQESTIPYFFTAVYKGATDFFNNDIREAILTIEFFLFGQSLYLLGGTIFRRNQFIFTSTAIILGLIFIGWIFSFTNIPISIDINKDTIKDFLYFIMGLLPVMTAAIYFLSYFIFKRMQVVNNKWINL